MMFDIIGSIIGVLIVFNIGVWVGKKYYTEYVNLFKKMLEKIKSLFKRNKTK